MRTVALFSFLAVSLLETKSVLGAATTNATCSSSFTWMSNSLGQSPCLVAAYLESACTSGNGFVSALPAPDPTLGPYAYFGPASDVADLCSCSWAVYNLISACGACQDSLWRSWTQYEVGCISPRNLVSSEVFPSNITIPSATVIPAWAAKDPATWSGGASLFNLTEAKAIGSQDYVPSTSTSPSSSGTESTTQSSTSVPQPADSNSPPVGPIVGGVVGGVLGLALVAVLAVFLMCPSRFRRKSGTTEAPRAPSQQQQHEKTISASSTPMTLPGGATNYDTATMSTTRQGLLATDASRPPLVHHYSSSVYSNGTSGDHLSLAQQPGNHLQTPMIATVSSPPPNTISVYSSLPETSTTTASGQSIRSFFTSVTSRQGHAHTLSDTSITSGGTSVVRGPQAFWRRQGDARESEVSPYILPTTAGGTSTSSALPTQVYPADRKQRPQGLQYSPPPPATPALPEVPEMAPYSFLNAPPPAPIVVVSDNSSTVGGPGPATVYGMIGSSIVDEEIDRHETMTPANASSILEAAPPYSHEERHDTRTPRHAPTLPDVREYPEEKARFNSTSPEL